MSAILPLLSTSITLSASLRCSAVMALSLSSRNFALREKKERARANNSNFIHMNVNKPNRCEPPELIQFVAFLALSCARKREKKKNYFGASHTKRRAAQARNARRSTHNVHNLASWTKQIERHKRLLPRPNVLGTTVLLHLWEPTNKSTLGVKTKQTARERRRCAHSHRPRSHS